MGWFAIQRQPPLWLDWYFAVTPPAFDRLRALCGAALFDVVLIPKTSPEIAIASCASGSHHVTKFVTLASTASSDADGHVLTKFGFLVFSQLGLLPQR
jgi:hypothetical protein